VLFEFVAVIAVHMDLVYSTGFNGSSIQWLLENGYCIWLLCVLLKSIHL